MPNVSRGDSTAIAFGDEVSARYNNYLLSSACDLSSFLDRRIRHHQVLGQLTFAAVAREILTFVTVCLSGCSDKDSQRSLESDVTWTEKADKLIRQNKKAAADTIQGPTGTTKKRRNVSKLS